VLVNEMRQEGQADELIDCEILNDNNEVLIDGDKVLSDGCAVPNVKVHVSNYKQVDL